MRRHGTLVFVFIFVGAVLIAACAKPYHEESERYVFVATNINLPYWQEAQAGFLDAAKALGDRYASLVLGIGLRTLRDRGEAEDLVQEVFLSLCEKVRGFDPSKGSGRTWIVQIAYRRGFDRRAYLFRRKFYDGTELGHIQNTLQIEARYEEQIADLLTGEQLHAAFEELSEKQRATLEI